MPAASHRTLPSCKELVPVVVSSLFVFAGLALLILGGEVLLRGAVGMARSLGLSPLIIGLTVVAAATSMPELVVTVLAGLANRPELGLGNIIGSNIANILLICGVAAAIAPFRPPARCVRRDGGALVFATAVFLLAGMGSMGAVYWPQGVLFVGLLVLYIYGRYRVELRQDEAVIDADAEEALEHAPKSVLVCFGLILVGAGALIGGSELLIDGAVDIAQAAGLSDAVIGITLVAFGTSLPELATAIIAARRNHADVALGNILGSNIFNLMGIGGALALSSPFVLGGSLLMFDGAVMALATLGLLAVMAIGRRINRAVGLVFLVCYASYIAAQFVQQNAT